MQSLLFSAACVARQLPYLARRRLIDRDLRRNTRRCQSSLTSHESVTIPCKSRGSINLDIHRPSNPSPTDRILLYIPPGPSLKALTSTNLDEFSELAQSNHPLPLDTPPVPPSAFAQHFSHAARATVVQANYRLSRACPFPTPIHDVLAAFDYTASLAPHNNGEIGVCGELLGGSLALMLALTETRPVGPRVGAAVVHEPVVDWLLPQPAPLKKRKSQEAKSPGDNTTATALTLPDLHALRAALFPGKPASYFDPFASPIHFLRTPGGAVPRPKNAEQDFASLADLADLTVEDETLASARADIPSSTESEHELSDELDALSVPPPSPPYSSLPAPKTRKTRLRYPPPGHTLLIPRICITTHPSSALVPQVAELARLLQRALVAGSPAAGGVKESVLTEMLAGMDKGKVSEGWEGLVGAVREAEGRVMVLGEGGGFWGNGDEEEGARRVAGAFERVGF